jgi:hypothetical protein
MRFFNKRKLKIIGIVFGALIVIYFVLLSPQLMGVYRSWKAEKNYTKWEESIKEQYRNDTYGGDTPEETWGMFLSALEKRDFDLASKYFVLDEQEKMKNRFKDGVALGNMEEATRIYSSAELVKGESISKDKVYYYYPVDTQEYGIISNQVVFFFNPYSKVWKILGL